MPLVIALVALFGLLVFMWIAIAREPGPGPVDVALAYERAWDELDFDLLYDLSGDEMRDGLNKAGFVAAKRAAYSASQKHRDLHTKVDVDTSVTGHQTSLVVTRVHTDSGEVNNNVMLEKRSNGWVVVSYSLRTDGEQSVQS